MQRIRPFLRNPAPLLRSPPSRGYQKIPFNRSGGPQYKRFGGARGSGLASLLARWAARPTFYRDVGVLTAGTGAVYVLNLEEVPVSGRRRFNVVSARMEASLAASTVAEIQQQYAGRILADGDARVRLVRRVLDRLVPFAQGVGDVQWEVTVIESPEENAFVVPGGKVFVFTGILDACRDEDGVAAVLGHEIAHVVAHHTAYVCLALSRRCFSPALENL
jgi:Zn-dependent protease with chaperone function